MQKVGQPANITKSAKPTMFPHFSHNHSQCSHWRFYNAVPYAHTPPGSTIQSTSSIVNNKCTAFTKVIVTLFVWPSLVLICCKKTLLIGWSLVPIWHERKALLTGWLTSHPNRALDASTLLRQFLSCHPSTSTINNVLQDWFLITILRSKSVLNS